MTATGRYIHDLAPGSPPQTSRWRCGAGKQSVVTGCTRPKAVGQVAQLTAL